MAGTGVDILIMSEWDRVTKRIRDGLKRLGHDIPITGYSFEDNVSLGKRKLDKSTQ